MSTTTTKILMKPYLDVEEELVSVSLTDWPEKVYLAKPISNIFWSVNRGHDPRNGIWNEPICLVILSEYILIIIYISAFSQRLKITKPKTKMHTDERKCRQPQFQLHLITKSCGRWKLGFTNMSSVAQFIFGKWCHIQLKLFVKGKFTEHFHF